MQRLLGSTTAGNAGPVDDYFALGKFTAVASGDCSQIRVYSKANGNVKAAVYADSTGSPGARLAKQDTGQAVTADQWNTITLESSCSITASTDYWLAFCMDTDACVTGYSASTDRAYKADAYATFTFPDPAGDGFSTDSAYEYAIAGWGPEDTEVTSSIIVGAVVTATRATTYNRAASIIVGAVVTASRNITAIRASAITIGTVVHSTVAAIFSKIYIGTVITASKVTNYNRAASIIVGNLVTATRGLATFHRSASTSIGAVITAARTVTYTRTASVIVGVVTTATRVAAYIRSASVSIGVVVTAKLFRILIGIVKATSQLLVNITASSEFKVAIKALSKHIVWPWRIK